MLPWYGSIGSIRSPGYAENSTQRCDDDLVAPQLTRSLTLSLTDAGELPVFSDVYGATYEVRGEEGSYYNLLTSPHLSINAKFVSVPEGFEV